MLPIANSSTFRVQKWEGKAVWPKGTPVSLDEAYIFRDGECAEYSATNDKFVPLKPIPDWIRNAMPNPPYTVKPAY